jgi:putative peptidoglycan lipid II flippase
MLASLPLAATWGLWVVAASMVAGAALGMALHGAALTGRERRAVLLLMPGAAGDMARMFRTALPLLLFVALTQALFVFERLFASGLRGGALSHIAYATKIYTLPVNVVGLSLAAVLLPALAVGAANGDPRGVTVRLRQGLGWLAAMLVPTTILLIAFAPVIVRVAFERGAFDSADTHATAQLVQIYALALLPIGANLLLSRGLFAWGDMFGPARAAGLAVGCYVVLGLPLSATFGVSGLALDMVIASCVLVLALGVGWRDLTRTAGRATGNLSAGHSNFERSADLISHPGRGVSNGP